MASSSVKRGQRAYAGLLSFSIGVAELRTSPILYRVPQNERNVLSENLEWGFRPEQLTEIAPLFSERWRKIFERDIDHWLGNTPLSPRQQREVETFWADVSPRVEPESGYVYCVADDPGEIGDTYVWLGSLQWLRVVSD